MGQFLVIGIASRIVANKKEAEKAFKGIGAFKEEFEKSFNASNIYRLQETDDVISLELIPEVAEKEWLNFIRDFYRLRYGKNEEEDMVFEELSNVNNLEGWLGIAKHKSYQSYQKTILYDCYMDNPYGFYDYFNVKMEMVALSCDGKIWMECYGQLFGFFTRLIREKLSQYRLAESLYVDITS